MSCTGVNAERQQQPETEGSLDGREPEELESEDWPEPSQKLHAARLRYCRKLVSHKVAEAMPLIVDTFADKAKEGSIQHAHALLKLSGTDPAAAAEKRPKRYKSFAGELLKEIRRKPPVA